MNRLIIWACPAVAGIIGCSTSTPPAEVHLPESLSIASIGVAGTPESNAWSRDNPISNLSLSCNNAPLVVETDPKAADMAKVGFVLDVAGKCGTQVSCGWLVLRVASNDAGGELDIASATTPMVLQGVNQSGSYTFSLELHDASDNILHTSDGKVLGQEVTIDLIQPSSCPATGAVDAG
jgi:hypothetical protein